MTALADRSHRTVGMIGIAVVVALAVVVTALAAMSPGKRTYTVLLEHTAGLRIGEEVQVAGVEAGEITAIELQPRSVSVRFTLDDHFRLGADTRAEVKVATLLGTHFLLITPQGEGELDDATIPMAQTRVAYNLQDVLDDIEPELAELDTALLAESFDVLADTLEPSKEELLPALEGIRDLSITIDQRSNQFGQLLGAAEDVTRQLADSSGDIVALMRQSDLILDELRKRRDVISALLRDTTTLARTLEGTLADTRADTGPLLRDLRRVIRVLRTHDKSLTRGVRSLAVATRYFANASGNGPWLDQHLPTGIPDNLYCGLPDGNECR
ncbi:MCE family protein [Nocardioides massiliensis]|uniref:Phospholipid/cholesterol/gamma-HCH transport system substrate-binding protein n=1 Tax=Nocardioides massiliensis TaxID=1325935 RepID=A0ABT9NS01_9ACTN|nr:MCE family protein [Nocardioides massiliensis]MDP9823211.1 phospholipid/cholesterol/gamma-HCH transport system substrate-binding protein [Nocardioides massiliensis]